MDNEDDNDEISSANQAPEEEEEDDSQEEERQALARKETRTVSCLRLVELFLLVSVALAVSLAVFLYTKQTEENDFEDVVEDHASKVMEAFRDNAQRRVQAVEGFSTDIKSRHLYQLNVAHGVVLPDFERCGTNIPDLPMLSTRRSPSLWEDRNRKEWEQFSVENPFLVD